MIIIYYFEDTIIKHVALMATGLGKNSFNISWYSENQTLIFDLLISKGKLRNIDYDLMESKKYQRVCIPSLEDGNAEGISEIKIYNWLSNFKKSKPLFSILNNNCARVVLKALQSGLDRGVLKELQSHMDSEYSSLCNFIITPKMVIGSAKKLHTIFHNQSNVIWGIDSYLGASCKLLEDNEAENRVNYYLKSSISNLLVGDNVSVSLNDGERKFLRHCASALSNLNRSNITLTENFCREFFDVSSQLIEKQKSAHPVFKKIIMDSLFWLTSLHEDFSDEFKLQNEKSQPICEI